MNFPSLVVNQQKAILNIKKMVDNAVRNNLELRPHFKTHQSHVIGNWFRDFGITAITVSSLKMAEYFANDGWENITIAFPVNILESSRLNKLASSIDLRVLATDKEVLKRLDSELSQELGIYIELDPGYKRSGIPILDFDQIKEVRDLVLKASNLRFEGFYTHAGHSYKCRSRQEILSLSASILKDISHLKAVFNDPVCYGDTPSCSVMESFGDIDQISPGNFVFYDWTQFNIGSCSENDIAIAMFCPIVAKYPERNELVIHGGAVHFSKDSFIDEDGSPYYGVIAKKDNMSWSKHLHGNFLKSISQEHGIVKCTSDYFDKVEIGDLIPIIPIHSCLTADSMAEYYTLIGENIDHMNSRVFK